MIMINIIIIIYIIINIIITDYQMYQIIKIYLKFFFYHNRISNIFDSFFFMFYFFIYLFIYFFLVLFLIYYNANCNYWKVFIFVQENSYKIDTNL